MLRPYQTDAKRRVAEAWLHHKSVMMQMPTGTGKTRLFVSLIADVLAKDADARILIVVHRRELVRQISLSLQGHYGLMHGIVAGAQSRDVDSNVIVASVQAMARVLKGGRPPVFNYVIVDEAHHSLAPSYRALFEAYADARKLGVTATPYRLRGSSFAELYEVLLESLSIKTFIRDGYLADYDLYTVSAGRAAVQRINRLTAVAADGDYRRSDLERICGDGAEVEFVYQCYAAYGQGGKALVYAVSRSHAAALARCFMSHGVKAVSVDSHTPLRQRERALDDFRCGRVAVMVNVELFTEGLDCPSVQIVVLARPTRSLAMYMQQVGRALRPLPGGGRIVILDVAGLYARFGLPDRQRNWQGCFAGAPYSGERYRQPLGSISSLPASLMMRVERKAGYASVQPQGLAWQIGCNGQRQYLLDGNGNRLVTRFEFRGLQRNADGNYSGRMLPSQVLYAREWQVRFTPQLHLLPVDVLGEGGAKVFVLGSGDNACYALTLNMLDGNIWLFDSEPAAWRCLEAGRG